MMSLTLLFALQAAVVAVPAQPAFDLRTLEPAPDASGSVTQSRCGTREGDRDIVVCAQNPDKYRLPLTNQNTDEIADRVKGEAPSAVAAITPRGRCGMFEGERKCSKAEAARYGYGQGRDPLTLLMKLGSQLTDPDSDVGPPQKFPK